MKIIVFVGALLLSLSARAETVVIEANGPWYPGTSNRVFKCSRTESIELTRSTKRDGWVSIPKTNRVEGCDAGIWPGRSYRVFILMESYDHNNQLLRTDTLPPYFVWIPPIPATAPQPPRNLGVS